MEKLPRGRHGLPREFVERNQRERLIAALAEALYERGYDKTTVSAIGKRASVSKSDFLASEPAQGRLALVEGLRAGRGVYDRYQEALQSFVPYLRDGAPTPLEGSLPEATDEAVVGGIASLLARRVLAGETEHLAGFLPEVAEFALTPYLGPAEARRIISE